MLTRPIPSTGEQIPVIGLGGRWISANSTEEELADHRAVLHALAKDAEGAGRVFDSAAGYGGGGSESYAGQWAEEDGFGENIFWATKVNVVPSRGGGAADPSRGSSSDRTLLRSHAPRRDRSRPGPQHGRPADAARHPPGVQGRGSHPVHRDDDDELAPVRVGLEQVMRDYPIDFIGIDYAIDNRTVEDRILPLAQDEGIAVMVYLPFGRSPHLGADRRPCRYRIGRRSSTHTRWAQFMLKFTILAHPAVTVAAPGTGDPGAHDRQPRRGPGPGADAGARAADDRAGGRTARGLNPAAQRSASVKEGPSGDAGGPFCLWTRFTVA